MIIELSTVSQWWTWLPVVAIFGSIASIFGAAAEKRAASEAMRILNEARAEGTRAAGQLETQFQPIVEMARNQLTGSFETTGRLVSLAELGATTPGLLDVDRISLEDSLRILNENLVSTGNLRSGAAGLLGAELGRRTVADSAQRRLNYLQLALGGAGTLGSIAGTTGQLGLGGLNLATSLRSAVLGLAAPMGQAALQRGRAEAGQLQAIGGVGESLLNLGLGAFGGFAPGSTAGSFSLSGLGLGAGGVNFGQLFTLQQLAPLFGGRTQFTGGEVQGPVKPF